MNAITSATAASTVETNVQFGRTVEVEIFKTSTRRGWRLRCKEDRHEGQFIDTYRAEIITDKEATRRKESSCIHCLRGAQKCSLRCSTAARQLAMLKLFMPQCPMYIFHTLSIHIEGTDIYAALAAVDRSFRVRREREREGQSS
jgi:hypothetical protein